MQKIGIIGGGFSGTMTAINLITKCVEPLELKIINKDTTLSKGIAYSPYSKTHLLNVIASKMSAFPDKPLHFVDWLIRQDLYKNLDLEVLSNSFMPRYIFGTYLEEIWQESIKLAEEKKIKLDCINELAVDIDHSEDKINLLLENGQKLELDYCVVATGNLVPKNPRIINSDFYKSEKYFQNPWKLESVTGMDNSNSVLILGNGLTMVDSVLGLMEHGFKGVIYSLSPNGFNILPHRHGNIKYTKLLEELSLSEDISLKNLTRLVIKHVKAIRKLGISAEPIIDSLRPHTQRIWYNFTDEEKLIFMKKYRHLWGIARHRIPLHIHDKLINLRLHGLLKVKSGKLINLEEKDELITVNYFDSAINETREITVSRIINCTGPESDLLQSESSFLKNAVLKGIITQDKLKLGIRANIETYELIDAKENTLSNVFTLGGNLKGELWESTAINELRTQAERLAEIILVKAGDKKTAAKNSLV